MRPLSTRFVLGVAAGLCVLMIAGCASADKPKTVAEMRKAAFGTPLPPDMQAKLNAQGAALEAKQAQAKAAALAQPSTPPPSAAKQ